MSHETLNLPSTLGTTPTLVFRPEGAGPHPAIVLSTEAYGINEFTHITARDLCAAGYVVVVPDYYRGRSLKDPDDYTDFTEVMGFIETLDFGNGTHDILAGVDYARSLPEVDPARVGVWGYCTGGTLAMMAASLDRDLAGAVIFFPSQITFPELDDRHPVHALDLLWNVKCPIQFLYGDADEIVAPMIPEIDRRLSVRSIPHQINVYEGAWHAFSAPVPPLRNEAAAVASWTDATAFMAKALGR